MRFVVTLLFLGLAAGPAPAQTRPATKAPATKTPTAKPAAAKTVVAAAGLTCPSVLGIGTGSRLEFCDVLTGRDPAEGVLIHLPPHKGPLTLTFDLHNRHTYSEDLVKGGKGYASYTATIGILEMDGTLVDRGVVRSEFRSSRDLLDRVRGGAAPTGLKAVAPIGTERIVAEIAEEVNELSLLGERLSVTTSNGTETFTSAQRPIAVVSNVNVEYQPAPAKPAPKAAAKKKPVPAKK